MTTPANAAVPAVPGLVARKIGMTRMVDAEGQMTPVTLLQIEPQKVTKVLTTERDGYNAVQVGYYIKKEKALTRADMNRLRKVNVQETYSRFKEFRLDAPAADLAIGTNLELGAFEGVSSVDISGLTKGRGFSGSVKRWGTTIGRMTHGSMYHRRPGSLGNRATPARVFKNKVIPGCYGDENVTIQNLQVMDIDKENRVLAIKGSVPGHREGFLVVYPSIKSKEAKAARKKK
jgi:large subunit ribosomal protein L3